MLTSILLLYFKILLGLSKEFQALVQILQRVKIFFWLFSAHLKHQILEFLQFKEGKMPVNYLGVPLLKSVLQEGNWIWAQARSTNAVSIQSKLCSIDFAEEERPIVNIIVTNQSSSCLKSESGF